MLKVKRYTKDECDLILQNALKKVNKKTHEELAVELGRTVEGIRKKELELKRKHLSDKRKNANWTEKEIETLQEILRRDNFTIKDILNAIKGRDINIIKEKALELRTNDVKYNKPWTEEDIDYLKRWWGLEDVTTMGIMLGRSREALRQRAKILGICSKKIYHTARECSIMLGISDNRFLSYIQKGYVNSRKAKTEQLIYQIKPEELLDFMKNHQDKWDSRNMTYEPFFIEKPEWYIEKCKKDKANPAGYLDCQKKWTDKEYSYLLEAKSNGVSFEEIAEKLNRTITSVKSKYERRNIVKERKSKSELKKIDYNNLNRLKEEYKNEKSYILKKLYKMNAKKMTDEDFELCSNLRILGYNAVEISKMVGLKHKFLQLKLLALKDEEYIVHIDKKDFTNEEEKQLLDYIRDDYSLYELCMIFKRNYPKIINTYTKLLEELYNTKAVVHWSIEEEIKLMLLKTQGMNNRIIGQKVGGRSAGAIKTRTTVVSYRKYTSDDNRKFIKDEDKLIKIYFEQELDLNILCSTTKRSEECLRMRYKKLIGG